MAWYDADTGNAKLKKGKTVISQEEHDGISETYYVKETAANAWSELVKNPAKAKVYSDYHLFQLLSWALVRRNDATRRGGSWYEISQKLLGFLDTQTPQCQKNLLTALIRLHCAGEDEVAKEYHRDNRFGDQASQQGRYHVRSLFSDDVYDFDETPLSQAILEKYGVIVTSLHEEELAKWARLSTTIERYVIETPQLKKRLEEKTPADLQKILSKRQARLISGKGGKPENSQSVGSSADEDAKFSWDEIESLITETWRHARRQELRERVDYGRNEAEVTNLAYQEIAKYFAAVADDAERFSRVFKFFINDEEFAAGSPYHIALRKFILDTVKRSQQLIDEAAGSNTPALAPEYPVGVAQVAVLDYLGDAFAYFLRTSWRITRGYPLAPLLKLIDEISAADGFTKAALEAHVKEQIENEEQKIQEQHSTGTVFKKLSIEGEKRLADFKEETYLPLRHQLAIQDRFRAAIIAMVLPALEKQGLLEETKFFGGTLVSPSGMYGSFDDEKISVSELLQAELASRLGEPEAENMVRHEVTFYERQRLRELLFTNAANQLLVYHPDEEVNYLPGLDWLRQQGGDNALARRLVLDKIFFASVESELPSSGDKTFTQTLQAMAKGLIDHKAAEEDLEADGLNAFVRTLTTGTDINMEWIQAACFVKAVFLDVAKLNSKTFVKLDNIWFSNSATTEYATQNLPESFRQRVYALIAASALHPEIKSNFVAQWYRKQKEVQQKSIFLTAAMENKTIATYALENDLSAQLQSPEYQDVLLQELVATASLYELRQLVRRYPDVMGYLAQNGNDFYLCRYFAALNGTLAKELVELEQLWIHQPNAQQLLLKLSVAMARCFSAYLMLDSNNMVTLDAIEAGEANGEDAAMSDPKSKELQNRYKALKNMVASVDGFALISGNEGKNYVGSGAQRLLKKRMSDGKWSLDESTLKKIIENFQHQDNNENLVTLLANLIVDEDVIATISAYTFTDLVENCPGLASKLSEKFYKQHWVFMQCTKECVSVAEDLLEKLKTDLNQKKDGKYQLTGLERQKVEEKYEGRKAMLQQMFIAFFESMMTNDGYSAEVIEANIIRGIKVCPGLAKRLNINFWQRWPQDLHFGNSQEFYDAVMEGVNKRDHEDEFDERKTMVDRRKVAITKHPLGEMSGGDITVRKQLELMEKGSQDKHEQDEASAIEEASRLLEEDSSDSESSDSDSEEETTSNSEDSESTISSSTEHSDSRASTSSESEQKVKVSQKQKRDQNQSGPDSDSDSSSTSTSGSEVENQIKVDQNQSGSDSDSGSSGTSESDSEVENQIKVDQNQSDSDSSSTSTSGSEVEDNAKSELQDKQKEEYLSGSENDEPRDIYTSNSEDDISSSDEADSEEDEQARKRRERLEQKRENQKIQKQKAKDHKRQSRRKKLKDKKKQDELSKESSTEKAKKSSSNVKDAMESKKDASKATRKKKKR